MQAVTEHASRNRFANLISACCALTGRYSSIEYVMEGASLTMLGVSCMLFYSAPDTVVIWCEMGEAAAEQEAQVCRELLGHNFHLYDGKAPLFARDPETGELLCLAHCRVDGMTPLRLHAELVRLASMVRRWQKNPVTEAEVKMEMATIASALDTDASAAPWRSRQPSLEELEAEVASLNFDDLLVRVSRPSSTSTMLKRRGAV